MHEILLKFAVCAASTCVPSRLTQSDMHALTEMETTDVEDEEPPTPPKPKPFTPNPVLVGPRMETRWHTAVEVGGKIPYN